MHAPYNGPRWPRIERGSDRDASACWSDTFQDSPATYEEWKTLVLNHKVRGVNVHDARLVAAMMTHGITHILTANGKDFQRYPDITVVTPQQIE